MKRPTFLSSFFSIQWSGSKFFTSPAKRQSNPVASKWVMGAMPPLPARRLLQTSSVPIPQAQTRPTPVTTTRRLNVGSPRWTSAAGGLLLRLGVFLDVRDGVFHRGDLFGVFVGNLNAKRFFEGHHQFNRIERVGAQIV